MGVNMGIKLVRGISRNKKLSSELIKSCGRERRKICRATKRLKCYNFVKVSTTVRAVRAFLNFIHALDRASLFHFNGAKRKLFPCIISAHFGRKNVSPRLAFFINFCGKSKGRV